MRTHSVTVSERVIIYPHNERVISRNVSTDQIAATFDSEWVGASSYLAVFSNGKAVKRVSMSMSNLAATVTVPWECLENPGQLQVAFVAYFSGNARIVTKSMDRPFLVAEGGDIDGEDTAQPTKDILQQAIDATSAANTAASSANSAAGSANSAASSANSAAGSANTAANKATESASGADKAASGATAAANKADVATGAANAAAASANAAAEEARGSVMPERTLYLAYDEVDGVEYISLVDTEE